MSSLLASFFDGFLFNVAAIAAVLTAFDWLVGENGRKKLRERVGDFWTRLQYHSLDELYVKRIAKAPTQAHPRLRRKSFVSAFHSCCLRRECSVGGRIYCRGLGLDRVGTGTGAGFAVFTR